MNTSCYGTTSCAASTTGIDTNCFPSVSLIQVKSRPNRLTHSQSNTGLTSTDVGLERKARPWKGMSSTLRLYKLILYFRHGASRQSKYCVVNEEVLESNHVQYVKPLRFGSEVSSYRSKGPDLVV